MIIPTRTAPHRTIPAKTAAIRLPNGSYINIGPNQRVCIGTDAACDVVISDPFVSKRHCAIERRNSGLLLHDLGSKNGCFVDENRVQHAELRPGARVRCGDTTLVICSQVPASDPFAQLVGEAPTFVRALDMARRAAFSEASVLILGETGTGKELFAAAIHQASRRSFQPYVAINCGAIPNDLIASELFGHVHGAFTGASQDRNGVFVRANGGSLFLDELGELPLHQQPHLLRVLETRRVTRVGDDQEIPVDVRLIAATNRLSVGGVGSALRSDLYHRVATIVIELPPLRARVEDIAILSEHFLRELAPQYGPKQLSPLALSAMRSYHWPGNVRELRQALHRAAALSRGQLELRHLLPGDHAKPGQEPAGFAGAAQPSVRSIVCEAYRRYGTIRAAAASIGMPKSTFADHLKRYGVNR